MKQIQNFICVPHQITGSPTKLQLTQHVAIFPRNHKKHHVGNKVNKPAKIQFQIHLWYWDLKDTIDTQHMMNGARLTACFFFSRHLGRIWNCSFCRYTWLYVTTHTWLCGKFLKHWNMANSLMGGARSPGYEICTTMKQIMARWWSDNINIDNMLI